MLMKRMGLNNKEFERRIAFVVDLAKIGGDGLRRIGFRRDRSSD